MAILTRADRMAVAATGQDIKELPKLVTVPYGYYLHRDCKRITRQQADSLYTPFHQGRGLEFLCMVSEYPLATVEACVYLRAVPAEAVAVEVATEPKPNKKANKRRKKRK